jgi:NAD(P)-dependent dehydrogenase (short-subunit alcohol dehydrogenase family)
MAERVAIVTGGASGIGKALAAELVDRGATVLIADIAGERAKDTAEELTRRGPGNAVASELDVRDAEGVQALVDSAYGEYGRLDLIMNNAGIAVGGAVHELTLEHWNRIIDVNLRGVIHGVHAAYPRMKERGTGQILNTASLAGLTEPPMMAPYVATKHAVVGLTLSLRVEAAMYGVKVSALCPGFVDTPLLDSANPDLPQTQAGRTAREAALRLQRTLYQPEALAKDIVAGLAANKPLIVAPASARAIWRARRYAPGMLERVLRFGAAREAKKLGY